MAESKGHRGHRRVREATAARYAPAPRDEEVGGVLLDSDVIIELLRGRPDAEKAAADLERAGVNTYTCAVSWAEIFAGIRLGEETAAEEFFQARGEVVLDGIAGRRAGAYLSRYARSHGLEIADALVAAAASTAGLRLWTMNRRHYPMPDLKFYPA